MPSRGTPSAAPVEKVKLANTESDAELADHVRPGVATAWE
jgi:hypothetical protein